MTNYFKLGFILIIASAPIFARPGGVHRREARQTARIRQGVKNGTVTKDEAQNLRAQGKSIKEEQRAMRKENGGKLTQEQRKQLNSELDARGQAIRDAKKPAGDERTPASSNPNAQ